MKSVSKDARGFVEGVVAHLKTSGKAQGMMPRVQTLLWKMTARAKHEHEAVVESAVKLTSGEIQSVSRLLSGIAGHEVSVTTTIVPRLVGGLRIVMADWVVDASIESELQRMATMVNS